MRYQNRKFCKRCLAQIKLGRLCAFCQASDARREEARSRQVKIAAKDAFGAVRNGTTKGVLKRAVPLGTVTIRQDGKKRLRFVKVKMDGPPKNRWTKYARWWWEKNKGPGRAAGPPRGRRYLERRS